MAAFWVLISFIMAIFFVIDNGVGFAFTFIYICWIPMVAVAASKWGLFKGDNQQKIVVPSIAIVLLLFAYWLSTGVQIHVFGVTVSGLILGFISAAIGITIPLEMATRWGSKSH